MISAYIQMGISETKQIDGEWLVLNKDKHTITRLNDIGAFCWSLLYEIQSIESLMNEIEKEFAIDLMSDTVREDIEDFLFDLYRFGLIRHVD